MKFVLLLVFVISVHSAEIKDKGTEAAQKDKRQTQDELVPHLVYRTPRKQEHVAPVEEPQDEDKASRNDAEEYRPGQVFSLNAQELLDLQPERKAPLASSQQLQQLYANPQPEHKQNLQQFYYLEPQVGRQVSIQPSHAVIARPHYSANGGEASVGAALSVSDTGARTTDSFDQELLALLSQPVRQEDPRTQSFVPPQQTQPITTQSVAPQYQQVERYITKPSKKPTKLRSKVQITPPQAATAPQQYLIETTNVQQQQQQPQQQVLQYRPAPQSQRAPQTLRYVPIQAAQAIQQPLYERPEGLKVVPAPKLQQVQPQFNYRILPQYQQQEATPKQYRIIEVPRPQPVRQEQARAANIERPLTYLKRFPEPEKMRAIKLYDQQIPEGLSTVQQPTQIGGEQYYLRPVYRPEQRSRYETPLNLRSSEQPRSIEPTKAPLSSIYVSKNVAPKKVVRPVLRMDPVKYEQQLRDQAYRIEQPSSSEQVNIEHRSQNLEEQRAHLPPPRNNKAYTPEEFAALVAAGYSVTPIPVGQVAQSRSSVEPAPVQLRRPLYSRRHQYLPLRGDEAP